MNIVMIVGGTPDNPRHRFESEFDSVRQALSWAVVNWAPAQGPRRAEGPGYYLNEYIMLSVDGGDFEDVRALLARA